MGKGQWQNLNINVDLRGFEGKLSPQAFERGRTMLADQVLVDSNQYVPADLYTLRNTGHVNHDSTAVLWNTPYGKAQFYGSNGRVVFRHYTTPNTGKLWHGKAVRIHRSSWERVVLKGMGV